MAHYVVAPDAIADTQGRIGPLPGVADAPREWWAGGWIVATSADGLTAPELQAALHDLADLPVRVMVQAVLDGLGSDQRRPDEVHELYDLSHTDLPGADKTGPFTAEVRLGDLLVQWDLDRAEQYATLRRAWLRENGHPRVIENTDVKARHPWPDEAKVQGGDDGVVFTRDPERPSYRTAFVEAFIPEPETFLRGEGATIEEAEDAAWAKFTAVQSCPSGHATFETRGYRNGAGFCTGCGMFQSDVFDVKEVGHPCSVCGAGCFWTNVGDDWFCKEHAPQRTDDDDRFGMREEGLP